MRRPLEPVLLIDDDIHLLASFENLLNERGISNTLTCSEPRDVEGILAGQTIGVVVMDLDMPHLSGQELLPIIKHQSPDTVVLIVTGATDVDTAIACMRAGAADYLVKPIDSNRLTASVQHAIDVYELRRENTRLKQTFLNEELQRPEAFRGIVTRNRGMRSLLKYVEAIAESSQCVLITGSTGVGKELVARAVHTLSNRTGNFVAVNVAGLDDIMFSDTLFGHARGAFTGADSKRSGMVESASGGTLFLDEIGDLSVPSQVKLLRLLQESEYLPLGSDEAIQANTRIVAATNRSVEDLKAGTCMRSDLYYRLAVHIIRIPPLCQRQDDIPLLLRHFVDLACEARGRPAPEIDDGVVPMLQSYSFPGNVREFEALVHDLISTHEGAVLSVEDFRARLVDTAPLFPSEHSQPFADVAAENNILFPHTLPTLEETQRAVIVEAMRRYDNNQTHAARSLGISRQTLNRKWKDFNTS